MADRNEGIISEFRSNQGRVGGYFAGLDLLLLHYTGAKTGKQYVKPLAYTKDGDDYVIVASMGGAPKHPQWYFNLLANPDTAVEVGTEKFNVRATEAKGDERERLFNQHAAKFPQFNDYKAKTTRVIPVFLLERV